MSRGKLFVQYRRSLVSFHVVKGVLGAGGGGRHGPCAVEGMRTVVLGADELSSASGRCPSTKHVPCRPHTLHPFEEAEFPLPSLC